nr:protein kinase-like domain, concanavalin A-like lectin/glucanase domain protein [Tanacetum cinerariifolium]GEX63721.1 protein kinase-like domain, concanavalin A-like lectin/glucanase domain protein [Tanacetum cinerariifolium]
MEPNAAKGDNHSIIVKTKEEVKEESKEPDEGTKGVTEEEEEDGPEYLDTFPTVKELSYHEWILKTRGPFGLTLRQAYIDPESPTNVISKLNYSWIMSKGLKSRRKPSNPEKTSNFVGRVKRLKVFVGKFTYECNFVMLEDTTSIIDQYLGGMILGKPFVKETELVYDKDEGTVTFERDKENITFKMPHKMESFKHIDKDILKTNNISHFIIIGDDGDQEKTHYLNSLNLRPAYRCDESVIFDEEKPGSS